MVPCSIFSTNCCWVLVSVAVPGQAGECGNCALLSQRPWEHCVCQPWLWHRCRLAGVSKPPIRLHCLEQWQSDQLLSQVFLWLQTNSLFLSFYSIFCHFIIDSTIYLYYVVISPTLHSAFPFQPWEYDSKAIFCCASLRKQSKLRCAERIL